MIVSPSNRRFKGNLKILKYSLFAQLLIFVNLVSAHDAETNKPFEKMHAHRTFSAHTHSGWESRYFSEGRDALNGKSLWNSSLELGYDHLSGGVWYGRSSNHQYDEWQYNFAFSQEIEGYSFYAGYTHLIFTKDDESDDEWSAGISYDGLPLDLITSLDACYSIDAQGTFFEWSTSREFNFREDLDFSLSGTLGWNEGYVSDGHSGLNFFSLRSGVEKMLSENFSLAGHGVYSWAINPDLNLAGDQGLKDFFHFGLGVEYKF